MPNFNQHFDHFLENTAFLENVNVMLPTSYRWKATACYYAGLHLIHAYLDTKGPFHPTSHEALKNLISPSGMFKDARLDANTCTIYEELEMISRQARYRSDMIFEERHFVRAVELLDKLCVFFCKKFPKVTINKCSINCADVVHVRSLNHFELVESGTVQA